MPNLRAELRLDETQLVRAAGGVRSVDSEQRQLEPVLQHARADRGQAVLARRPQRQLH